METGGETERENETEEKEEGKMVNKKKNNYFFLSNPTTDFSGRARTL